jgi:hypothetical protein
VLASKTPWKIASIFFFAGIITGYVSYRLDVGRRNPAIWKDKDIPSLLRHAALSGCAKIGFHSLRGQNSLLTQLESVGITKQPSEDIRDFLREKVVNDRKAFETLRGHIMIEMIHNGKQWFWDGHGNRKTAQFFHEAEIIVDLKSTADYMFSHVLEGL